MRLFRRASPEQKLAKDLGFVSLSRGLKENEKVLEQMMIVQIGSNAGVPVAEIVYLGPLQGTLPGTGVRIVEKSAVPNLYFVTHVVITSKDRDLIIL